jgi:hypothetical protein
MRHVVLAVSGNQHYAHVDLHPHCLRQFAGFFGAVVMAALQAAMTTAPIYREVDA